MKVADMDSRALDFWVAKALGMTHPKAMREMAPGFVMVPYEDCDRHGSITRFRAFRPSSDWADGGPIIERQRIEVSPAERYSHTKTGWTASLLVGEQDKKAIYMVGDTPLVAAMRAFVASKFDEEVTE